MDPIVVVHGGTQSPEEWSDGCAVAAERGAEVLREGGSALDAAVAATIVMENDGRFNAGRGSVLRLDGKTIEADAGIMDSSGLIGAVAAMRGVKNPILAALAVADTPHLLLAGEGATRFAEMRGLAPLTDAPSEASLKRHERAMRMLRERTSRRPAWREADLEAIWNFPDGMPDELRPADTVGVVARDAEGRLAAANSTGGAVPMMLGRVGDSPLPGAGFWAGPSGAVATTGVGEEIVRRLAAKEVYDRIDRGASPAVALAETVALFPDTFSFGAVAVSADAHGVGANRTMAKAVATP
ncbi:MAG: isoaspartyl peptidase/L-asparaginase [Planctomycetota bacterium]|jgi:L-asparaginase/beta-aspartyl-peptidase (threonine type)